jgi:hypothetical protein
MSDELELEVLCERLGDFVPKKSTALISDTSASIERVRRDIILHSRQISLHLWYSSPRRESIARSPREYFRALFRCRNQGTFPGISQLSQNSAFLINSLVNKPEIFAEVVTACVSQSGFDSLIQMTIPALFAFFSSDEQLTKALSFYRQVCRTAKPDVCVRILEPFFNSPATFRFLEHALARFFRGFLLDLVSTSESDRNIRIPAHSSNLLQCLADSIPLLPWQHLRLLKEARDREFSNDTIGKLVLTRFCWPAAVNWLKTSGRDDCLRFFERVLSGVSAQRSALGHFYDALFERESMWHPPKLFKVFGHCYLLYFLSVNDVLALTKVLADQNKMPAGLSHADFADLDPKYRGHWFWSQVFERVVSKGRQPESVVFHNLILGDDVAESKLRANAEVLIKLANTFERFLDHRYKCERLKMWDDLLETQVNQLMMLHLDFLRGDNMITFSRTIQQVMSVQSIDQDLVARSARQLLEFSDDWDKLAAGYRDEAGVKRMLFGHNAARRWIWMGAGLILCDGKAQLHKVVTSFLKSFVQFHTIALELELGISLMLNIIAQLPAHVILVPFVLLNATVTRNPHFMSQTEQLAWSALESCILFILQDDLLLLGRIDAISDQITEDYTK